MIPRLLHLNLSSEQIQEIKQRFQSLPVQQGVLMPDDENNVIDPPKIQREIELNFLLMIIGLQENLMNVMLNDSLDIREGFFTPGIFPDETINSTKEQIRLIKDLCLAFEAFSNTVEFSDEG